MQKMTRKMAAKVALTGFALAFAPNGYSEEVQCNKKQTRCYTDDRDLSIGDEVGVFTTDDELIAVGTVKAMRGSKRLVSISESTGTIRKGHRLALLERSAADSDVSQSFKIYRDKSPYFGGASFGLATAGVGQGVPAMDFSGFGGMRRFGDIDLIGRVNYLTYKGEISRATTEATGTETQSFSVHSLGLAGGVGYTWMHNRPLSVRGEVAVGFAHVTADVGGDAGEVEGAGYPMKVSNGFGKLIRGGVSGLYNMNDWKIELGLSNAWIHDVMATGASFGVIRDIR